MPSGSYSKFEKLLRYIPHDVLTFVGCLSILTGLFVSRAMMSIGMMILFGNALFNIRLKEKLKSFIHQPHLMMLTGYFLLLSLSFFWSDDVSYFVERLRSLLPFLVLPFAFHASNKPDPKWMDFLFLFFISLTILGMSWSLFQYIQHKESFDHGYGLSHVIPTPFKNDHIRFSLAVVLSICLSIDLFFHNHNKWLRLALASAAMFGILYLHILAVKTGLLAFYMISFLFFLRLVFQRKYRKPAIAFFVVLIGLPFLMYTFSTSFRNKISYVNYSMTQIRNDSHDPNISDEGRIISYRYAVKSILEHPWLGVGSGDVYNTMKTYYDHDFPDEKVTVLLPHNQFLMAGMSVGILGILYLLVLQWLLFRLSFKLDFLYFSFWCMMFLTMMVEPLYETQHGTCMFLFFLLLLLQRRTRVE